jgi:hypothetical protein
MKRMCLRTLELLMAGFCLLITSLATPPNCAAQTFVDMSSQVTITKSGLVLNRATNTFNSLVTIKNSSSTVLNAPLVLVISNLTPTTVTLANPSGQDPSGNPFVNLNVPTGGLSPGQSISNVLLQFQNPARVAFSFTTQVEFRSGASISPDGSSIVFKTPGGATVLTILLLNQEVVISTPQGNVTNVTHQLANISDDASHVGVYTNAFQFVPAGADTELEGQSTSTFAYYGASGQLWQITADPGNAFYLSTDSSMRLLTSDGSRILMISAQEGDINPSFTVYDQNANVIYQSAGTFSELDRAQISPNGMYLLVMGLVYKQNAIQGLITVTNITNNVSSSFPFSVGIGAVPVISISSDGRFLIAYQGNQVTLP